MNDFTGMISVVGAVLAALASAYVAYRASRATVTKNTVQQLADRIDALEGERDDLKGNVVRLDKKIEYLEAELERCEREKLILMKDYIEVRRGASHD